MTGQTINGTKRPDVPTLGPLTPIRLGGIPATTNDTTQPEPAAPPAAPTEPTIDHIALAEADRIRTLAEAEAEAVKIKAAEDARRLRLANDKAERRAAEEAAASQARIAELERKTAETRRAAERAEQQQADEEQAAAEQQSRIAKSAASWRKAALGFAIICGIVALPVQMSAFYSRSAPWLLAAPLVLEGGAWVVLRGAAAAVDEHRPHWHYRLIAWALAFLAAGINLSHGLTHFGTATAVGTAFASLAGPGVWDLHEHGRLRTRDGKLTRAQRRAQRRTERAEVTRRAAEEKRRAVEKEASEKAAREAAEKLAATRQTAYADEWKHAQNLAAALGETSVTETVWRRAWRDIHGTDPGDTVDIIRGRNNAARRLTAATSEAPGNTPSKVTSTQRANQMPRPQRGPARKPPPRRRGDTAPYVQAARTQAAITAKNAARNTAREDS